MMLARISVREWPLLQDKRWVKEHRVEVWAWVRALLDGGIGLHRPRAHEAFVIQLRLPTPHAKAPGQNSWCLMRWYARRSRYLFSTASCGVGGRPPLKMRLYRAAPSGCETVLPSTAKLSYHFVFL
jgi:hypothetical protein